ncbi:MAG: LysE family transporter [Ginsengibacter sp.]
MIESLITISIVGLIVGFIFSMPVAGPISILITTNALKGRVKFCEMAALGASVADFVYVFAAVFGLTKFYSTYKPLIPYILLAGTLFLLYLGYKISNTTVDLEHLEDKSYLSRKKGKGGFWTGFMLNFLNPTLFLGWLTSSFLIISLVSSLGFNTGGLNKSVDSSFHTINTTVEDSTHKNRMFSSLHLDSIQFIKHEPSPQKLRKLPKSFTLFISASYAFFLSLGSIIWFFYLTFLLSKYRRRININVINKIIRVLGWTLCLLGLLMGYKAIGMII